MSDYVGGAGTRDDLFGLSVWQNEAAEDPGADIFSRLFSENSAAVSTYVTKKEGMVENQEDTYTGYRDSDGAATEQEPEEEGSSTSSTSNRSVGAAVVAIPAMAMLIFMFMLSSQPAKADPPAYVTPSQKLTPSRGSGTMTDKEKAIIDAKSRINEKTVVINVNGVDPNFGSTRA